MRVVESEDEDDDERISVSCLHSIADNSICRGDAMADVDRNSRLAANDPLPPPMLPFNDSRIPFGAVATAAATAGGGELGLIVVVVVVVVVLGDPRFIANMG